MLSCTTSLPPFGATRWAAEPLPWLEHGQECLAFGVMNADVMRAPFQVYIIWSILFIVYMILIIVTAFITIALTYFQLAVEDHRW